MSITQQSDEQGVNQMFLPYDDTVHARCQISHKCALLFNPDVQFADINCFCHNIFLLLIYSQILDIFLI